MSAVASAGSAMSSAAPYFLQVEGLKKHFGGVKALNGVIFSLQEGEVHALVGENGAGKSTLIKVLSGVFPYDAGSIMLDGKSYSPATPHAAKELGIQVVHQEFNLLDHLSIAENISIESLPKNRFGLLDRTEMYRRAQQALNAIGLDGIDVTAPVRSLGIAHKQLVEIARALQSKSKILILDEPTATLTERETRRLFDIVRAIKADGVTVVFVSHHLEEVFDICDRVTVFRNGETITTQLINDTSPEGVVQFMVGRRLQQEDSKAFEQRHIDDSALRLDNLCTLANPENNGISLDLHYGEIVGIAGLVGAGRSEILRAIFGMDALRAGRIFRDGKEIFLRKPKDAIDEGIGFVTENRKDEGLILPMSIAANVSLAKLEAVSRLGLLRYDTENSLAKETGTRLKLKAGGVADPASSLSGGNQQKVVLAKWLAREPRVLLLDEPTRGVDVGAKAEIHAILKDLAREGVALLVVSSEMPELMTLADRIVVLAEHEIQGELKRPEFSEERILKLAYGQADQAGDNK